MFDQLFTATQINDEIADRDGLDAEAKKGLVLKTKFLNQRGLLTNEPGFFMWPRVRQRTCLDC